MTAFTTLAALLSPAVWMVTSCLMLWRGRQQEVLFDGAPNDHGSRNATAVATKVHGPGCMWRGMIAVAGSNHI